MFVLSLRLCRYLFQLIIGTSGLGTVSTSGLHLCLKSDNVDAGGSGSGVPGNIAAATEIILISFSVTKLKLLPVYARHPRISG